MNKNTAPRTGGRKILLRWVEEKGFKVTPIVRQSSVSLLPANHTLLFSAKERGLARKPVPPAAEF